MLLEIRYFLFGKIVFGKIQNLNILLIYEATKISVLLGLVVLNMVVTLNLDLFYLTRKCNKRMCSRLEKNI